MRRIAHISDLHFGRHDPDVAAMLLSDLAGLRPDLVAVSGDLTQRARRREFAAARDFLASIAAPLVVVPGNHDVPLYNVATRMLGPLRRFRRFITAERLPSFVDGEVAVLGINTARAAAVSNGRVSFVQIDEIRRFFDTVADGALRVLVSHHPLANPPHLPDRRLAGRARHALDGIAAAGIDLVLTGHDHQAWSAAAAAPWRLAGHRAVIVSQAGTAISTRLRDEVNSWNLLTVDGDAVVCEQREWRDGGFRPAATRTYRRADGHWRAA